MLRNRAPGNSSPDYRISILRTNLGKRVTAFISGDLALPQPYHLQLNTLGVGVRLIEGGHMLSGVIGRREEFLRRKNLSIDECQHRYSAPANLNDDLLAGGQP